MSSKITLANANITKYLKTPIYTNLADRTALGNFNQGELIYVSAQSALYYYDGTNWVAI